MNGWYLLTAGEVLGWAASGLVLCALSAAVSWLARGVRAARDQRAQEMRDALRIGGLQRDLDAVRGLLPPPSFEVTTEDALRVAGHRFDPDESRGTP